MVGLSGQNSLAVQRLPASDRFIQTNIKSEESFCYLTKDSDETGGVAGREEVLGTNYYF